MHYTLLPHRGLLCLTGEDAVPFLQGLLTNDVSHLAEGGMIYSALLSPQGKFQHDFFVSLWQGCFWIDSDASRLEDLRKRLMLYRLRSKVVIEPAPETMGVAALWGGQENNKPHAAHPQLLVTSDPRLAAMGWRMIGDTAAIQSYCEAQTAERSDVAAYERWRIELAIPDGAQDMTVDRSLLLEFGFEALHGVDFKKGCYVGQEVTARSKFRAQLRKGLYRVQAISGNLPPAGTEIHAGGTPVGEMRSSSGDMGLAIVRTEELDKAIASQISLKAGEVVITAQLPEWMASSTAA